MYDYFSQQKQQRSAEPVEASDPDDPQPELLPAVASNSSEDVEIVDGDGNNNSEVQPPPPPLAPSVESSTCNNPKTKVYSNADIGVHIKNISQIDDQTKCLLLEKPWVPPHNYKFPHCTVIKSGKSTNKYAQRSHLERFLWLVVSDKDQALYFKYCAIFVHSKGIGRHNASLGKKLVTEPVTQFDDLLGTKGELNRHELKDYHKQAVEMGKNFLLTYHKADLQVATQLNEQLLAQKKENRERIMPIVKTIIFCGRENLPLRGHRDSGALYGRSKEASELDEDQGPVHGQGVFRALLDFRVESGDEMLRNHLLNAGANATYISPRTQNELIECCKDEIQDTLIRRVKEAPHYSLMFDESPDAGHKSQ